MQQCTGQQTEPVSGDVHRSCEGASRGTNTVIGVVYPFWRGVQAKGGTERLNERRVEGASKLRWKWAPCACSVKESGCGYSVQGKDEVMGDWIALNPLAMGRAVALYLMIH